MQKLSLSDSDDYPFDRSTAPRPLYRRSEDGSASISFREGETIPISRADMPPNRLFSLMAFASAALGGQPVCCSNFLPGISLRIALSTEPKGDADEVEQQFLALWEDIREPLDVWLCKGAGASALLINAGAMDLRFGRPGSSALKPSVMGIDIVDDKPLAPVNSLADCRTEVDVAIERAIQLTTLVDMPQYDRLPVPIRYRAVGATKAWSDICKMPGQDPHPYMALVGDERVPPMTVVDAFNNYVETRCTEGLSHTERWRPMMVRNSLGAIWHAFWARHGTLYEPTEALERLLGLSDITGSVPVIALRPPVPTLSITTRRDGWNRDGEVHGIGVFRNFGNARGEYQDIEHVSVVVWAYPKNVIGADWGVKTLVIPLSDPTRPLVDSLGALWPDDGSVPPTPERQRDAAWWRNILDYVAKVMLYLSLDDAQVQEVRAYTNAPRTFPGLGKRKREEKLAQVEMLYDRYLVGPTVVNSPIVPDGNGVSSDGQVRSHWRRGHFRQIPYGPKSSLRRVQFIMPTLVRADRLGG